MHRTTCYLLLLLLAAGCSRKAYHARFAEPVGPEPIPAEAVAADLDYLFAAVERAAPLPYLTTDSTRVRATYQAAKQRGSHTPLEFYESLLKITGSYEASHYFVRMPKEVYLAELSTSGSGLFPCFVSLDKNELTVDRPFRRADSALVGAIVHRVNGLDADSLFQDYYQYFGGTTFTKHYNVRDDFHHLLFVNGLRSPFTLDITDASGQRRTVVHDGHYLARKDEAEEKTEDAPPTEAEKLAEEVEYRTMGTTGYLRISALAGYDYDLYRAFLAETFATVRQDGVERLVVDLRGNGGGNDQLGRWLLDYVNDQPYRFYGGQYMKISPEARRNFRYSNYLPWLIRQLPFGLISRIMGKRHPTERNLYETKAGDPQAPDAEPLRFAGQVYFTIDNGTYSSGVTLANAVGDYKLATLVGQPTGGAPNEPGELLQLKLPRSGFQIYLPSKYFIRANGNINDPNPVLPDVTIDRDRLRGMSAADLVDFVTGLERKEVGVDAGAGER